MSQLYADNEECWFVANKNLCELVRSRINAKLGLPNGTSQNAPIYLTHETWGAILFKGNWMNMVGGEIPDKKGKIMDDETKLTIIDEVGGAAEAKPLKSMIYLRDTLGFPQFQEMSDA